jgi:hypothetical protein
MNVQIYFNEEVQDIVFNTDEQNEWQELAKELGLDNQLGLADGDNSVVPYQWMNTNLTNVCKTLCPSIATVESYDKAPIPLKVMQQLAFVKKENHFEKIDVWYDDKSPDPFLVGTICKWYNEARDKNNNYMKFKTKQECKDHPDNNGKAYSTDEKQYLIARWGDENKSFKQLTAMAAERLNIEVTAKLKTDIESLKAKLAVSKENITLFLAGEKSRNELDTTKNW